MNEPIILSPTMFVTEEEKKATEDNIANIFDEEERTTSSIFEKSEGSLTDDEVLRVCYLKGINILNKSGKPCSMKKLKEKIRANRKGLLEE